MLFMFLPFAIIFGHTQAKLKYHNSEELRNLKKDALIFSFLSFLLVVIYSIIELIILNCY